MANLAQIQSIAQGQFFVKDSLGNLTELKVGDTVSLNDTIVAASSNTDLSKIEILFDTNELITLSQGEQLLDTTLLASTFGNEELAFDKQEVDETLNAWNNAQDGDATDMETAAGDVTEQATNAGDERAADGGALRSKFNSRDGDATDIVSDLREASWAGGIERTNEDSENMLLEQPLPVVYTIIEGIDVVNEGDSANYVVKLQDAAGNPVIATQDTIIYVRYTNKTTQDGDTQYNNENIIEVVIKAGTSQTEFTIKTNDDYLADNGEIYNVSITGNNSTEFDMRTGDVAGNKTNVDTTILDNSKDTPNDPYDQTTTPPVETDLDTITIKLFALDKDGNRVPANEVAEGSPASYVAVAFDKNGGELTLNETVEVTFGKTGDTATSGGVDYVSTTQTVTLGKPFSTNTVDDYLADNGEKYSVQITDKTLSNANKYETVVIDTTSVTTTILDNSKDTPNDPYDQTTTPPVETDLDTITIKLFALDKDGNRVPANEVAEGSPASYVAVAFDKNGGELTLNETVEVTFGKTGDTATSGGVDYVSTTQTVTLGKPFSTNTVDDYLADNGEKYSVQITDKTLSNANKYETVVIDTTSVTTTILDNSKDTPNDPYDQTTTPPVETDLDTITIKLFALDKDGNRVPANEVAEGSPASYVAVAFDKNGGELTLNETVEVTFGKTGDTATSGGVDYVSTTQTVTLGKPFSTNTVDDYLADNGEKYSVQITDKTLSNANKYETVVIDTTSVTTTILDNSKDTPNDPYDQTTTPPVETDLDTITIKLFALDKDGNRVPANEVAEGSPASYVAVAFDKNGGELTLNETVEVTFGKTGDTATSGGVDYVSTTQTVTLGKPFSTNTVDDYLADNGEKYSVQITDKTLSNANKYETVVIDTTSVTTTILDNSKDTPNDPYDQTTTPPVETDLDTITIKLFALDKDGNRVPANEVAEGSPASYVAVAFDKNGGELTLNETVEVTFGKTGDTATSGGVDYVSTTQTVTLGKPFSTNTVDDYLADNGEKYSVQITDKTLSNANKYETVVIDTTSVTTTILDNKATKNHTVDDKGGVDGTVYGKEDTVYAQIIANKNLVAEGGEVKYTVKLVDAAGKEVKVTSNTQVTVTFNTNNSVADNEVELKGTPNNPLENGETIIITIPSGSSSSSSFTIKTKDDFKADNNETFKLKITDIGNDEFENLVYNHTKGEVTTTIKDGVTLGIPTNAYVDEDKFYVNDLDGTNGGSTDKTNISDKQSLGIKNPNGDNAYTLSFASKNGIPDIEVFKGNVDSKDGLNQLKSDGKIIQYKFADNNKSIIIGYVEKNGGGTEDVFKITLNKNSSLVSGLNPDKVTQDSYTYTQYKNIDHPVAGDATDPINDDNITFEFGFTISDQGSTSEVQTFKVTVNDSVPLADDHELIVYEDNSLQFVLSDGAFKDGKIKIDNNDGNGFKEYSTNDTVKIYEGSKEVGTIKILEGGKLEFKPVEDYSKYDASDKNKLPNFKYQVSDTDGDYAEGTIKIQVKPVADAPTIKVNDVTSYEDASTYSDLTTGNKAEGGNKIPLGLLVPSLSTDQKDKNNATGDSPERNGEITLKFTAFTNGQNIKDAELYNGNKKVADIENGTEIKIVIVDNTGQVDKNYHHDNVTLGQANTLYLTESEYESLKIQHAEDNDTDIKITIKVTSYEVDDSGKPLYENNDYSDNTNANLKSETTANMIVKIQAVTDDITLNWDSTKVNTANIGTLDNNVLKFNDIQENNQDPKAGTTANNYLDFGSLLTPTSGAGIDTKLDLDGSEKRSYTIKLEAEVGTTLPDYIYITIGNQKDIKVNKDANGNYKLDFSDTNNKLVNPEFKIKFPDYWSGDVTGTITLRTKDYGVDNDADTTDYTTFGGEADGVKKAEVKFEAKVTSIANIATIQVKQAIGYEDAGRGGDEKNQPKTGDILENGKNGIPLNIKVTSTDKDNSETFTIKISNIPNGGAIHYDGQLLTPETGKDYIEIPQFNNNLELKFIPPHNSHGDFDLIVNVKTIDGSDIREYKDNAQTTIKVVVKDVADIVVGNDYNQETLVATDADDKVIGIHKQYNAIANEDEAINLESIFIKDSTKLASYDKESEDLTIIIKGLPEGVTLTGNVTLINGQYIFKASDIPSIKIVTPANYSGELNFKIDYITTEAGKETKNPSKTFDSKTTTDSVSIFVKPTVDAGFNSNTTKAEDVGAEITVNGKSYYKLDLGISHQNVDTDETLVSVTIDEPIGVDYILVIKGADGTFTQINDFTKTYTEAELKNIYVQAPENKHGKFDITVNYTVKDSHYGTTESNYVATKTDKITHTLNITPVTDKPTITVETGKTHVNVNAGENTEIKIPIKVSSKDTDGSESITKIVISGVPQGVTISFGDAETDTKVTVSGHNGIYTIIPKDGNYKLNDADFKNIIFNVTSGADFEYRDITITAYTKDAEGSTEEQTSTKITLDKIHNGNGGGTGTGPKLDIVVDETKKDFKATEDTQFNFLDVFKVTVADNSNDGRTELNFKIDVGSNATLKGLDAYKNTDGSYTIKGNRADIESVLANLKVVPNKDFNSNQDADGISIKVETNGKESTIKVPVTPVTDAMTVEITSNDSTTINENGEFNFDIKLTNNSDKEFTKINDFYVVVNEKFEAGESSKGELYLGNTKLELVDGKYKLPADYKLGESLNLTYKSGEDRHGAVEIKVIAQNKETGATNELTSTGTTTITVKPVTSSKIEAEKVQDGVEDGQMASIKLNVVKADPSEKFESVLIKVASGVAVYYNGGNSLAMNVGDGSWIVPVNSDGTLPQIFFKGSEHLAGNIGFEATINVKDGESKVTTTLTGSLYIKEVADGVTIDPTKTGIDAKGFEWTSLNLNANMKDLDGSEKMYLELKGLGAFAQFKLKDGGIVESEYNSVNKVWTIKDIAYDKINDIQFTNDKDTTVDIKAWTTDGIDSTREKPATGFMEVDFAKNAVENGKFTLGKEVNIDFSKIENGDIKGVSTIDLSAEGENKLLNLTLQDVLDMGKNENGKINLTILGDANDSVSFAKDNGWQKSETTITENGKTFTEWSNTGDENLKVKVEQPISDGITN